MDKDFSFQGLMEFLKYVADHGLWKANTAIGYRSAASKVEASLTEQEAADVRQIDLDLLFQRYMNRNKLQVQPSTLGAYKRRLGTAIEEFARYREDPMNYRPQIGGGRSRPEGGEVGSKQPQRRKRPEQPAAKVEPPMRPAEASASTPLLTIPFPLRPDFLASVQIPRDLRRTEAERLAAFIRTLAMEEEQA